ncbi:MAG TPA: RNA polymerase sigma factor [Candidatus Pacearchaeota archaeon]|nr:RNA polymerase sigma factor [Candidatus Pacearchaeota archaeon]HQM24447.1 RNA polymerase sigma factor [Candidatus Pacearchaeota archaeon]
MQPQEFKEQFFSQIYDDYIDKVYRFVYFKTNTEDVAKDITSEVFTKLWKQIYLDNEIKNPSGFLFKTARNMLVDHYRNKDKNPANLDAMAYMVKDDNQDIEKKAMLNDDMQRIQNAMSDLTEEHRQAVFMYYIEQEPISEVAKSLGKTPNNARVIIHRGMKELKKILEA